MKQLFVAAILFVQLYAFAQSKTNETVSTPAGKLLFSAETNEIKGVLFRNLLHSGNDATYLFSRRVSAGFASRPTFSVFDSQMNMTASSQVDMENGKAQTFFEFSLYWNNKLLLFGQSYDASKGMRQLFYQPIDTKTMTATGSPIKANEFKGERFPSLYGTAMGMDKNSNDLSDDGTPYQRFYRFAVSGDSSKLMVVSNFSFDNKAKTTNRDINITVFDKDMKVLWTKTALMPTAFKQFSYGSLLVGNDGTVHILLDDYIDEGFQLLTYEKDKDVVDSKTLQLDGDNIKALGGTVASDGSVVLVGLYGANNILGNNTGVKGSCIFNIKGHEIKSNKTAFAEGFSFYQREYTDFLIRSVLPKADGGWLALLEEHHFSYSPAMQGVSQTMSFYYGNVLVRNIAADNTVKWIAVAPKSQQTANDGARYSSYGYTLKGDNTYIFFNDSPKNFKENGKNKGLASFEGEKATVAFAKIDGVGKVTRQQLFDSELPYMLNTATCKAAGDGQITLLVLYKSKFKLGRLAVD